MKNIETCYNELKNGQLTFLPLDQIISSPEKSDSFLFLLQFARKGCKKLNEQLKHYLFLLENDMVLVYLDGYYKEMKMHFDQFIDDYFKLFQSFSLEEIKEKYSDVPTDYHDLGKLFLLYLKYFVYKDQAYNLLNEPRILEIEQFILNDSTRFIGGESQEILKTIENRRKIRGVDSYIVYNIEPFFLKLQELLEINAYSDLDGELKKIQNNELLQQIIFLQGEKEQIQFYRYEIVVDFFLNYLNMETKYENIDHCDKKFQHFIWKVEDFIIRHFSNQIEMDKKREAIYEKVKKHALKRLIPYIHQEATSIKKVLQDFDAMLHLKRSGKMRFIEVTEDVAAYPKIYDTTEVKEMLEMFLSKVFLWDCDYTSENLPIFLEGYRKEKTICVEIGLEYLSRFVYSSHSALDSLPISRLEDFIYSMKTDPIKNSRLCQAKSTLLSRVTIRALHGPNMKRALQKIDN